MKKIYTIGLIMITPVLFFAQNVGIGTLTPSRKLEVKETISPVIARFTSTLPQSAIRFGTNAEDFVEIGHLQGDAYINTLTSADLNLRVNGYTAMKVQANTGRVGIGTLSPFAMLHVEGFLEPEVGYFINYGDLARIRVSNAQTETELGANLNTGFVGTTYDKDFTIRTNGLSRMTLKSENGNVGIGTGNPTELLHVYSPINSTTLAKFESNGGFGQVMVSNGDLSCTLGVNDNKGYVGSNSESDFSVRAGGEDVIAVKNGSHFVGIGTNEPECKFNVVSDQPNTDVAIFKNTTGNSSALITNGSQTLGLAAYPSICVAGSFTPTDFALQTFGQNRIYISNATGNIGIGTSFPGFPLHVHSNNQDLSLAKFDCVGGYGQIAVSNGTVSTSFGVNNLKGYIGTTSNNDFGIYTGSNELIHLRQDFGYVGVGTIMPLSKFHVETNDPYTSIATFKNISGYSTVSVTNNTQYLDIGVTPQQAFIATYNNTDFAIKTSGVNRIFIDKTNGYVGIGTNVPTSTLHVLSPTTMDQVARFEPGGGFNGYIKVGTNNNSVDLGSDFSKSYLSTSGSQDFVISTSGTERIHIKNATGSVGIGTDNPSAKLTVLGSTNLQGSLVTTGEVSMLTNCTVNGNLTVGSIVQPDRIPVTWFNTNFFHNLGSPYEDVTYYKDKENRVHLSGIVETTNSQTGTIFILPTGYRPLGNQVFAQMTNSGNVIRINVLSSGNVTIQGTLNGWVTMDGISFRAL